MEKIIEEIVKIRNLSKSTKGLSLPKKIGKKVKNGFYKATFDVEKNKIIIDLNKLI